MKMFDLPSSPRLACGRSRLAQVSASSPFSRLVCVLLLLVGISAGAVLLNTTQALNAQEDQPASTEETGDSATADEVEIEDFIDVVDVDIVNIDVWVTDKKGGTVDGLTQDDFQLFRDGQPVPVTNFYAVAQGPPLTAADLATLQIQQGGEILPLEEARAKAEEIPEEHRLWLILYVDNYNIDPTERNRVLPSLQKFVIRTLRTGDQFMVVTFDRSLEVVQPFTDELPELTKAIFELQKGAGLGVIRNRQRMETLRLIDDTNDRRQALNYARHYAEEQRSEVVTTARALERLVESLAGLPGRKALVHVSSGVPLLAGEEAFYAVAEKWDMSEAYSEIARHDTSREFERINRQANANRVSFYTVDAGGLKNMEFGQAEFGGFVDTGLRKTLDSVVPENLQSTLRLMAIETGGQVIANQNDILPALEKAAVDFRSFYSLGIAAADNTTGRYHKIEVKLKDKEKARGLKLRHRAGYRSKGTETRIREGLRSALLYAHQENPLNIKVKVGDAEPHGSDGYYLLPVQLSVPLQQAVLLPMGPDKHETRLKLFVGAVDDNGGVSEIDTAPLGLRLANEHVEAAKGEALVHTHRLLLSPGRRKIGVAVFDVFGRQSSIVTRLVQVGPEVKKKQG